MTTTAKPATLAQALAAAQAEMPAVKKDQINPHFKSRFVSLDEIIKETRPVLNKHGLAIMQLPERAEDGMPVLRTILIHAASGERIESSAPLLPGKQDMQGLGAAITYMRRFAWASACGIASEDDDDGNRAAAGATTRGATQARSAPPTPSVDTTELLDALRSGIARLAPENSNWTEEVVLASAAASFKRPIALLEELTADEIGQILAAMPDEQP